MTDANQWAYNEILTRMAMRGFTAIDLANWQSAVQFNARIGLYYCLTDGGLGQSLDEKAVDKFDDRERLWNDEAKNLHAPLSSVTGLLIQPSQQVVITQGQQDTSRDLFVMDPNDPRIGGNNGQGTNSDAFIEGPGGGGGSNF